LLVPVFEPFSFHYTDRAYTRLPVTTYIHT
jgi:hypothetical protein